MMKIIVLLLALTSSAFSLDSKSCGSIRYPKDRFSAQVFCSHRKLNGDETLIEPHEASECIRSEIDSNNVQIKNVTKLKVDNFIVGRAELYIEDLEMENADLMEALQVIERSCK